MYIPIIIDPSGFYEYKYLWVYLKFLYHCKCNNWPIIADEEFSSYRKNRPVSNVYEDDFTNRHQYKLMTADDEKKVEQYFIPNDIFSPIVEKTGSRLGAKIYLLSNRYKPFEHYLTGILKIIKKNKAKISGIITWNSQYASIRYVANKLGIPVITSEFSIRFPEYYPLAYFCQDEIYSQNEILSMYNLFCKQKSNLNIPLFSKKELLALFISKKYKFHFANV